jgi:hypothetical protein
MELQVETISFELDNDEGLNSLCFKYDKGYFTIARSFDEGEIYLEFDDQSNGEYFDKDIFEYEFTNGNILFAIDLNNLRIIKYLKESCKKSELYARINLHFETVDPEQFKIISKYCYL